MINRQGSPRLLLVNNLSQEIEKSLNCTALHSLHNSNQSNSKWKHCTKLETIVLHLFSVLAVPVEICRFGRKIVRPRNVVICSRAAWEITCFAPFQRFCLIWGQELQHLGFWWLFINREMKKCWHLSDKHNMAFSANVRTCELVRGCANPTFAVAQQSLLTKAQTFGREVVFGKLKQCSWPVLYSALHSTWVFFGRWIENQCIAQNRGGEVGTSSKSGFGGRCSDIWDTLPLNESALEQKSFAGWFALLPNIELHCDELFR